jgi:hypothetical protein
MTDKPLTARSLIAALAQAEDIDAPVIVWRGLFGHQCTYVRAHGSIATPDYRMKFERHLPSLTIADATYDIPDDPRERGPLWKNRARELKALLDQIMEPWEVSDAG